MSHTGSASHLQMNIVNHLPSELVKTEPVHVADLTRQIRDTTDAGKVYNETSREAWLEIPRNEVVDFRRGWFEFGLTLGTTAGVPAYKRASNGIWTCVRSMELRVGDRLVQKIDHYNMVQSILYHAQVTADAEVSDGALYGIGTQADRNTWGSATRTYALPIGLHSMTKETIATFGKIHHARMKIRIIFDDPSRWVELPAGFTPTFSVTNLRLVYDQVFVPVGYKQSLGMYHATTGIKTVFDDFIVFETAFDTSNVAVKLTPNKMSVRSLVTVFIDDANRNDPTVNDKFEFFQRLGLIQYQHKFQNQYYQEKPVQVTTAIEVYQEFQRWRGALNGSGNFFTPHRLGFEQFYNGDSFMVAVDLNTSTDDPNSINNVSTHDEGDIDIEFQFTAPPAARTIAFTVVQYTGIWNHGGDHSDITIS